MRALAVVLLLASLLVIAPAEAGPGSGASCEFKEEYFTQAHTDGIDPSHPTGVIQWGAPRPYECYY